MSAKNDNSETVAKDVSMQVASMGAETLSYKDFDPACEQEDQFGCFFYSMLLLSVIVFLIVIGVVISWCKNI